MKGFRIGIRDNDSFIPLTAEIADRQKAELAYSLLYYMAEENGRFGVDGKTYQPEAESIQALDGRGDYVELELDKEWYGTEEDAESVRRVELEKARQEAEAEGEDWDQELEWEYQDAYSAVSFVEGERLWLVPETWSYDKANDMANMLAYGMASNVEIHVLSDDYVKAGNFDVVTADGDVLDFEENPRWAETMSSENPLLLTEEDLNGLEQENMEL